MHRLKKYTETLLAGHRVLGTVTLNLTQVTTQKLFESLTHSRTSFKLQLETKATGIRLRTAKQNYIYIVYFAQNAQNAAQ